MLNGAMTLSEEEQPFRRLTGEFVLRGVGLHSGQDCVLRVSPAEGGLFLSAGGTELPIEQLGLDGSSRGADYIFPDGRRIRTCEHVLSALTGMGVWEARLSVEGGEMPALDGCAGRASEEILRNSEPCGEGLESFKLASPLIVGAGERLVAAFPAPEFRITYIVRYDTPVIGTQMLSVVVGPEEFYGGISQARTFAMASEIEALRAHGMALGGSLDNAILVGESDVQAAGGLRWPDEFVRHKALDLVGDMAALGRPLRAHVVAMRAGHDLHLRLAGRLRRLAGAGCLH
ncbi:MAG: UDP-3-O-acyl-N-acetylglucosamine deacetylase [Fretibacterium sp.]|nr:UDP-3-O-acyl-N-acetylglucosamine deacetylase [Fretibacterium sp.]